MRPATAATATHHTGPENQSVPGSPYHPAPTPVTPRNTMPEIAPMRPSNAA